MDRWNAGKVSFVFGIDAGKHLYVLAGELPPDAWKTLVRRAKHEVKTKPRQRPENVKQQVVEAREFEDLRLVEEQVAEFRYRPTKCKEDYRIVAVLPEEGRWQERRREEKRKLLRMDFTTFRHAMMSIPAQILSTGRRIVYRLLAWNPWQPVFFRLLDQLRQPLRC